MMYVRQTLFIILALVVMTAHAQLLDMTVNVSPCQLHFRIIKGKIHPSFLNQVALDITAEHGPYSEKKENGRSKADQRRLVKAHRNRRLLVAKGSSHNIPHDRPAMVIEQIVNFYKKYL